MLLVSKRRLEIKTRPRGDMRTCFLCLNGVRKMMQKTQGDTSLSRATSLARGNLGGVFSRLLLFVSEDSNLYVAVFAEPIPVCLSHQTHGMRSRRGNCLLRGGQKLRKRRSLALPSTVFRAAAGSTRAISTVPIIVEKIAKKARSLSTVRRPGMNGSKALATLIAKFERGLARKPSEQEACRHGRTHSTDGRRQQDQVRP